MIFEQFLLVLVIWIVALFMNILVKPIVIQPCDCNYWLIKSFIYQFIYLNNGKGLCIVKGLKIYMLFYRGKTLQFSFSRLSESKYYECTAFGNVYYAFLIMFISRLGSVHTIPERFESARIFLCWNVHPRPHVSTKTIKKRLHLQNAFCFAPTCHTWFGKQ